MERLVGLMPSAQGRTSSRKSNFRVITSDVLEKSCENCPLYMKLHENVLYGFPTTTNVMDNELKLFKRVYRAKSPRHSEKVALRSGAQNMT